MTEKGLVRVDERPDAHIESELRELGSIAERNETVYWQLPEWVIDPELYHLGDLTFEQRKELRRHVVRFAEALEQFTVMEMYASEAAHETRVRLAEAKRENKDAIKKRDQARKKLQAWKRIIPGL